MRFWYGVFSAMLFFFGSGAGSSPAASGPDKAASQSVDAKATRQNIQGNWQGTLNSSVGKLRLVLKVSKAADGTLKATMDSPIKERRICGSIV